MEIIDYEGEIKKKRLENIQRVQREARNPQKQLFEKINNFRERHSNSWTNDELIEKIKTDEIFAAVFAVDPAKQNLYENLAADFIRNIDGVENFINLPNQTKMFVVNGEITSIRSNEVKSIDFTWNVGEYTIYSSHKYTGTGTGTAQKHQYFEQRNFMRNCLDSKDPHVIFLAICDGPYYERFGCIEELNNDFRTPNSIALTSRDLPRFCESLSKGIGIKSFKTDSSLLYNL